MAFALDFYRWQCGPYVEHGEIQGGRFTKSTAKYPIALGRQLLVSTFGSFAGAYCMPCVAPTTDGGRRVKDRKLKNFAAKTVEEGCKPY